MQSRRSFSQAFPGSGTHLARYFPAGNEMDLLWRPVVHSAMLVDVPLVTVGHETVALRRYIAAYDPFIRSGRKRFFVYREYAEIARGGRFVLPFAGEKAKRRFTELHTALLLHAKGFFCWGGVHLFYPQGGRAPKGRKTEVDTSSEVRSMVRPWRWPSEIQATLDFEPKNPDIVAYSEERNEWRFCEVKALKERIHPDQLKALAVLHLLTGAPVAVVRVIEDASVIASRSLPTEIAYKKGAKLDWIHPSLRNRCTQFIG